MVQNYFCDRFYYASHEKTWYRNLQARYPSVCTDGDIQDFFSNPAAVNLYNQVVQSSTEWPTYDYSLKTLARFLGFQWQDAHPSGADSIEWFDQWVKTGDQAMMQRILDYNEDDCRATRVLLDGIRKLEIF